jgi:CheY-like chemotaxis protein
VAGEAILVVDDTPANLRLARVVLETQGYDVRTAVDAEEALGVLTAFRPQLILMDIQLPGVDGLQLTRRLKADPETRHIVIVAVTAYAMKGDEQRFLQAGCDGYISKPFDTRAMPGLITEYLRTARSKDDG